MSRSRATRPSTSKASQCTGCSVGPVDARTRSARQTASCGCPAPSSIWAASASTCGRGTESALRTWVICARAGGHRPAVAAARASIRCTSARDGSSSESSRSSCSPTSSASSTRPASARTCRSSLLISTATCRAAMSRARVKMSAAVRSAPLACSRRPATSSNCAAAAGSRCSARTLNHSPRASRTAHTSRRFTCRCAHGARTHIYVRATGAANRVVSELCDPGVGHGFGSPTVLHRLACASTSKKSAAPADAVGPGGVFPTWPKSGPPEARLARPPRREGGVGGTLRCPRQPVPPNGRASGRAVYLRWRAPTAEEKT
jgi:hypothetical protein